MVEYHVTAELKERSPWSAVQDITGRILRGSNDDNEIAEALKLNSLVVQGNLTKPKE
jgi:hypothetical protein